MSSWRPVPSLRLPGSPPWVVGDKDGYGGAWWFANLGIQSLAFDGRLAPGNHWSQTLHDAHYTGWYATLDDMVKKGYVNQDSMSMDLSQGAQAFAQARAPCHSGPTA